MPKPKKISSRFNTLKNVDPSKKCPQNPSMPAQSGKEAEQYCANFTISAGNDKIPYLYFDLPAGYTCPYAKQCLTFASLRKELVLVPATKLLQGMFPNYFKNFLHAWKQDKYPKDFLLDQMAELAFLYMAYGMKEGNLPIPAPGDEDTWLENVERSFSNDVNIFNVDAPSETTYGKGKLSSRVGDILSSAYDHLDEVRSTHQKFLSQRNQIVPALREWFAQRLENLDPQDTEEFDAKGNPKKKPIAKIFKPGQDFKKTSRLIPSAILHKESTAGVRAPAILAEFPQMGELTNQQVSGQDKDPSKAYTCYAAVGEARMPAVQKARWHNYNLLSYLLCATGIKETARIMAKSIVNVYSKKGKGKLPAFRIHTSGDFTTEFNKYLANNPIIGNQQTYMKLWVMVGNMVRNAMHKDIIFYAYTKNTPDYAALQERLPPYFKLVASGGGSKDDVIVSSKLRHAISVATPEAALAYFYGGTVVDRKGKTLWLKSEQESQPGDKVIAEYTGLPQDMQEHFKQTAREEIAKHPQLAKSVAMIKDHKGEFTGMIIGYDDTPVPFTNLLVVNLIHGTQDKEYAQGAYESVFDKYKKAIEAETEEQGAVYHGNRYQVAPPEDSDYDPKKTWRKAQRKLKQDAEMQESSHHPEDDHLISSLDTDTDVAHAKMNLLKQLFDEHDELDVSDEPIKDERHGHDYAIIDTNGHRTLGHIYVHEDGDVTLAANPIIYDIDDLRVDALDPHTDVEDWIEELYSSKGESYI